MVGKTLANRYELLEKIGEGGMARVYRGRDHLLKRNIAIKVLKDQMTGDADFVKRFRREAQSAAGLSHPNIVNIYDVGEDGGIYYIVMEYVEGKNLKQHIREKGRLPAGEAVSIARQIAEALAQAHAAGVIHRDIKPQNIIFSRDGQVKVADFGIAIAADGSTLTCSDSIVGSVHYFSPEQARGNLAGKHSDLYSLGVILYEMVTGQVPFTGESPVSVAMKHIQEPVLPPRRLAGDIPEPLERIILKAVEKNAAGRYGSAVELLDDLILFQEKGAARALPEIVFDDDEDTRVMKPVSAGEAAATGSRRSKTSSPAGERRWLIPLLAVIFLSAALITGAVLFRALIFPPEVTVPEVRNMSQSDAVRVLEEAGLKANPTVQYVFDESIPVGYVVRTEPYQGRTVRKNRTINLYISQGPEYIILPGLYGKTEAEARYILEKLELKVKAEHEYNSETAEGEVFKQYPAEGLRLTRGEEVVIYVSMGSKPFTIKDLTGYTREKALEYLEEMNLKPRLHYETADEKAGTVISQLPPPGSSVQAGQSIDLVISSGPAGGGSDDD